MTRSRRSPTTNRLSDAPSADASAPPPDDEPVDSGFDAPCSFADPSYSSW